MSSARHDPTYLYADRVGRWVRCSCGWWYGAGTPTDCQLAFAQHLVKSVPPTT